MNKKLLIIIALIGVALIGVAIRYSMVVGAYMWWVVIGLVFGLPLVIAIFLPGSSSKVKNKLNHHLIRR